jgi:hypothetical protein
MDVHLSGPPAAGGYDVIYGQFIGVATHDVQTHRPKGTDRSLRDPTGCRYKGGVGKRV